MLLPFGVLQYILVQTKHDSRLVCKTWCNAWDTSCATLPIYVNKFMNDALAQPNMDYLDFLVDFAKKLKLTTLAFWFKDQTESLENIMSAALLHRCMLAVFNQLQLVLCNVTRLELHGYSETPADSSIILTAGLGATIVDVLPKLSSFYAGFEQSSMEPAWVTALAQAINFKELELDGELRCDDIKHLVQAPALECVVLGKFRYWYYTTWGQGRFISCVTNIVVDDMAQIDGVIAEIEALAHMPHLKRLRLPGVQVCVPLREDVDMVVAKLDEVMAIVPDRVPPRVTSQEDISMAQVEEANYAFWFEPHPTESDGDGDGESESESDGDDGDGGVSA